MISSSPRPCSTLDDSRPAARDEALGLAQRDGFMGRTLQAVNHMLAQPMTHSAVRIRPLLLEPLLAFGRRATSSATPRTPGKRADFLALDDDPLRGRPERIKDIPVAQTWMNG
jgi:hypothetical protein